MRRTKQGEFGWVDLAASDIEAQTRFYEALFGWTHRDVPTPQGPVYKMYDLDGATVAGGGQMGSDMAAAGVPTMWNTYVIADDADALAARAVELGGQIIMPAMDVMTEGRMVAISDPTGGAIFFWQARDHGGAERFFEPGSLIWNDLNTRDPERAAAFFTELLGWDVAPVEGATMPYWIISAGGEPQGGIMAMGDQFPAHIPPNWLVYFGAADVAATVDKAERLGAAVQMPPTQAGNMTFAVLSDPMGAVFAVMNMGGM